MIEIFTLPRIPILKTYIPVSMLCVSAFLDTAFFPQLLGTNLLSQHMILYTWLIFYPSLIPLSLLLLLGFLQDCITGQPMGLSVLMLLALYTLVIYNRQYLNPLPFWVLWIGFAGVEFFVHIIAWGIYMTQPHSVTDVWSVLSSLSLTIGCYPLVGWLVLKLHSKIHIDS